METIKKFFTDNKKPIIVVVVVGVVFLVGRAIYKKINGKK